MEFREYLKNSIVYLDGGMGTLLQAAGLAAGESPMQWNLTHPEVITELQTNYYNAGSNVVSTNTFGANLLHFSREELVKIIHGAIDCARAAKAKSTGAQEKFIALDMGPLGRLLKPFGDYDFEEAVACFAETVKIGVEYGVDLVFIETMNDCYETKAALLAVKENCSLPVLVSNAYGEDGKLMTGASPHAMVAMLEGLGADAIGVNCSFGPKALRPIVEEYLAHASIPVLFEPNAGLPRVENGRTVFDVGSEEFSDDVAALVAAGVRLAGGCCGTTPEHIAAVVRKTAGQKPLAIVPKEETVVSSYTGAVVFGKEPVLIGERINPTGKKRFKQALVEKDMGYILNEGLKQQEKGVHILDVNVGLPEIDEAAMLRDAVCELQAVINLPLQIDTADAVAMEGALRRYNGKAMINSVNGKQAVMEAVFPLVKKYGGVVVALTLDEDGIPATAEKRLEIARKILGVAAKYGIDKKDIVFDTLAMTVSADQSAGMATLEALHRIRTELGCHTSLGVSNISFGLPSRDAINGAFFTMALTQGLSAAIMNPNSLEMMKAYHCYRALAGLDANCLGYLEFAPQLAVQAPSSGQSSVAPVSSAEAGKSALQESVVKGLKEQAGTQAQALLEQGVAPMELVQGELIPALDIVGRNFEAKKAFLPQLLMSAEAAKSAFEKVKQFLLAHPEKSAEAAGTDFVLATVHGDIHDIGKNIVHLLLENYGFRVWDLGKDVPPEAIVAAVVEHKAPFVGLSALMTTTVPAMEETIRQLRDGAPWAKVIVGGAVLTQDYADRIGADFYAKDAMDAVRQAKA